MAGQSNCSSIYGGAWLPLQRETNDSAGNWYPGLRNSNDTCVVLGTCSVRPWTFYMTEVEWVLPFSSSPPFTRPIGRVCFHWRGVHQFTVLHLQYQRSMWCHSGHLH